MDKLSETGVIPPPEEPELPATRGVVPPPHTQHIRCQASAEAAQDGVLLGHREKDGRRSGPLPHETPPLYARQVSLREEEEANKVRILTEFGGNCQLFTAWLRMSAFPFTVS